MNATKKAHFQGLPGLTRCGLAASDTFPGLARAVDSWEVFSESRRQCAICRGLQQEQDQKDEERRLTS